MKTFLTWFAVAVSALCLLAPCFAGQSDAVELDSLGDNIALHKTYTTDRAPNAFPDGYLGDPMCRDAGDATQLTDGELAARCWFDPRTVGWWGDLVTITIDLGEVLPVDAVAIHLSSERNGLRIPVLTRVLVSDDLKTYHVAGELDAATARSQWTATQQCEPDSNPHGWIELKHLNTRGRYVTLSIYSKSHYLDEIRVFSGDVDASNVVFDPKKVVVSPDAVTPFFRFSQTSVANNVLTPLVLLQPRKDPVDLWVDLPASVAVAAPKPAEQTSITIDGETYTRFKLIKPRELYLSTELPAGSQAAIRLTNSADPEDPKALTQKIYLDIIAIPQTKPFQTILMNVGFADLDFWERWPNIIQNYQNTGLNLITPLGGNDYWYRLHIHHDPRVTSLIQQAKAAGLKVGGNYSPFCNVQINGEKLPHRPAVYLTNDKEAGVNCPRVYTENYLKIPDNQDTVSLQEGFKAGLDMMFLDSEPQWAGDICACERCKELWKEYLDQRSLPFVSLTQCYRDNPQLLQDFWDEFYVGLWGTLKKAADEASHTGSASLGLYGVPSISPHSYEFGNRPAPAVLYAKGILDHANPTFYYTKTPDIADAMKLVAAQLPKGTPIYPWLSSGDGFHYAYERTPADFRNRVLEILFNGGQGFIVWNVRGFDAQDYAAVAEVIQALQPYENILLNGEPQPDFIASADDASVKVTSLALGGQTLVLVTRYNATDPGHVALQGPELENAEVTLLLGGPVKQDGGRITLDFDGSEADCVRVLLVRK